MTKDYFQDWKNTVQVEAADNLYALLKYSIYLPDLHIDTVRNLVSAAVALGVASYQGANTWEAIVNPIVHYLADMRTKNGVMPDTAINALIARHRAIRFATAPTAKNGRMSGFYDYFDSMKAYQRYLNKIS